MTEADANSSTISKALHYLIFTEGYAATAGDALIRRDLCREAIRLGRLLDELLPQRSEVQGLNALMLLHDARGPARTNAAGDIVLLEDQDRSRWNGVQIDAGTALLDRALRTQGRIGPYAVQAAIAALHARARHHSDTDWAQIAGLYEVLARLQPTPMVELNRIAAISMVDGPAHALDLLDSLIARSGAEHSHLFAATRANLLQRLDRCEEARQQYRAALAAAKLEPERRWLTQKIAALDG